MKRDDNSRIVSNARFSKANGSAKQKERTLKLELAWGISLRIRSVKLFASPRRNLELTFGVRLRYPVL
jgi:hypothetical protein